MICSLFVFDPSAACIVAYVDSVQARLVSLWGLQSTTEEELSALLPPVLDSSFKGEL
jgi:hypothetical protein